MDVKRHEAEEHGPPPTGESLLEASVLRALLATDDHERALVGALDQIARRAGCEWAAIAVAGAPAARSAHDDRALEGGVHERSAGARIDLAWEMRSRGGLARSGAGARLPLPGLDALLVGSAADFEPREESLPLSWGGDLSSLLAARGLVRTLLVPLPAAGGGKEPASGASPHEAQRNEDAFPPSAESPTAALILARRSESPFGRPVKDAIASLAGPIGLIHSAGLRPAAAAVEQEIDRRVDERMAELSLLYDLSRSAGTSLRFEDLERHLVRSIYWILDNDVAAVLIDLPARRGLTLHLSRPASAECQAEAARETRRVFAALGGREGFDADPQALPMDAYEASAASVQGRLGSCCTAPLVRRGEVVGALAAFCRQDGAFPESRVRLFHTLANQASLTLDQLTTIEEADASRLQSIIDSMPNGVVTTDRQLRVLFANPAGRACLEALTGSEAPEVLDQLGAARFSELARPVLDGVRTPLSCEVATQDPQRIYALSIGAVTLASGAPAGLVLVLSDVTEGRMMQEQLQQAEKLSALGEMISGVAHELNNPLASVMGYAQLLQRASVPAEVRRKLDVINAESQRCQRIVQNLLSFARRHRPEKTTIDLNAVLTSVLSLLAYQLKVDDIAVRADLDPCLPPIHGDFHELQQVFLNLVNNAHHAMRGGSAERSLTITTEPTEDGLVRVEVRDTGCGIRPENLRRIFDPFFTTKPVGQGTGLGLSLAYGAVKEHQGRIHARSQLGRGTSFTIELPVSGSPRERDAAAPALDSAPAPAMGRILVVDDEPALSSLLAEALASAGHQVDTAADGAEALARVRERGYDLVISDVKMPQMDGRALHDAILRQRPELAHRIIFTTGDVASRETQAFLAELGASAIAKPFDVDAVLREVGGALRGAARDGSDHGTGARGSRRTGS